jgi:hypothetical protein
MVSQCNSCGSFDESIQKCQHCPTLICVRCRSQHERVCGEMRKRMARGEGPTIRGLGQTQHMVIPAPPLDPVDQGLAGIKELLG